MIIVTIIAVTLLVAALVGALVLVRLGVSREVRGDRLSGEAQTWLTSAARAVTGLYVRMPERTDDGDYPVNGIDVDQCR